MKFFSTIALCASTLATFAVAQSNRLAFTSTPSSVTAGQQTTLKYTASDLSSPVTITLRQGDPNNLGTVGILTTSATGGSYTWTVPDNLEDSDDYAFQITEGNDNNYSGLFSLSGAKSSAVAQASSSSASASVSAAPAVSGAPYNSANATSAAANATAPVPVASGASAGTGIPMARNTTMSSATLTASSSSGAASNSATTTSGGSSASTSGGAGYQGTSTGAAASASQSGSMASALSGSSSVALVLCAVAALLY